MEWDDPEISNDEILLRRVPRKPDFAIPDLFTGDIKVKAAALRQDSDGMSVHRDSLLIYTGASRATIFDWETHTGVEFRASNARETPGVGVCFTPNFIEVLGPAHASVRCAGDLPKSVWNDARAVIAESCVWMQEDPKHPGR